MRIVFGILLVFISFSACRKPVLISAVIQKLSASQSSILADGTTLDTITVYLNPLADSSNRYVTLTATFGKFISVLKDTNVISIPAQYYQGNLRAQTILMAPLTPGQIIITATPSVNNLQNSFVLFDTIFASRSVAYSIQLQPNSYGVQQSFGNTINITGNIKNSLSNMVSIGTAVKFSDFFENGLPAHGYFTNTDSLSNQLGVVSTIYSIDSIPRAGSKIYITTTVLDTLGNQTSIKNSISLTVIK